MKFYNHKQGSTSSMEKQTYTNFMGNVERKIHEWKNQTRDIL